MTTGFLEMSHYGLDRHQCKIPVWIVAISLHKNFAQFSHMTKGTLKVQKWDLSVLHKLGQSKMILQQQEGISQNNMMLGIIPNFVKS